MFIYLLFLGVGIGCGMGVCVCLCIGDELHSLLYYSWLCLFKKQLPRLILALASPDVLTWWRPHRLTSADPGLHFTWWWLGGWRGLQWPKLTSLTAYKLIGNKSRPPPPLQPPTPFGWMERGGEGGGRINKRQLTWLSTPTLCGDGDVGNGPLTVIKL